MARIKGWTRDQALSRVQLMRMSHPHTKAEYDITVDAHWSEWVIVCRYPDAPTVLQRKPRPGLRRELTFRVGEPAS